MKKLVKVLSVFVKLGERAASLFGKVVDAADRLLHYKLPCLRLTYRSPE